MHVQEAVHVFRQHVAQFNACVPYAGVSSDTRVDAAVLPLLFTLLPLPQPVGITVAPPAAKVRPILCLGMCQNDGLQSAIQRDVTQAIRVHVGCQNCASVYRHPFLIFVLVTLPTAPQDGIHLELLEAYLPLNP